MEGGGEREGEEQGEGDGLCVLIWLLFEMFWGDANVVNKAGEKVAEVALLFLSKTGEGIETSNGGMTGRLTEGWINCSGYNIHEEQERYR